MNRLLFCVPWCSSSLLRLVFGCRVLVNLGARRLASDQILGLGNPFVTLGTATQVKLFVELGNVGLLPGSDLDEAGDRKSTRLNSSHVRISYAVFCLKKKNATNM